MANSFLNLEDDDNPQADIKIGTGLKSKPKATRAKPDKGAVARAGEAHGFTRTTEPASAPVSSPRRGRPPLNEDMTYWRIYVSTGLREELNQLRDDEGRRLNDVLEDMLIAYKEAKGSVG